MVMKQLFPIVLLVIVVNVLTVDCLPEHVDYTLSVIEHLEHSQTGVFKCIFMNLNNASDNKGIVINLLKSIMSTNVVSYVIDGTFEATYNKVPVKPSLILVYLGNQPMPVEFYEQVNGNFNFFDTNSKVLVIGNLDNPYDMMHIMRIIAGFRFNLAVYIGIGTVKVIRVDYGKWASALFDFPDPEHLFQDAARDILGNELVYMTMTVEKDYVNKWMKETAAFINGSLLHLEVSCTESIRSCVSALVHCGADIAPLKVSREGYDRLNYRWIYEKSPESLVLVVPKGRSFNIFEIFVKPLTPTAWLGLLILLCSMELVQFWWPTIFKNDPILLLVCGLERHNLLHTSQLERMIFLPFILFFFLISSAYESKLLSFMTEKPSLTDYVTVQQVLDSGLKIKYDRFEKGSLMKNSFLVPYLVNNTDDPLYADGVHAYIKDSFIAEGMVTKMINYDFNLRRPKYTVLKERMQLEIYAYVIGMKSPLRDMLFYTYQVFVESGLMDKLRKRDWDVTATEERIEYREHLSAITEEVMLGIDDLIPAWIALGIGLLLSGAAFVGELAAKAVGVILAKKVSLRDAIVLAYLRNDARLMKYLKSKMERD